MKLEEVLGGAPAYIHMERFVNVELHQELLRHSDVNERYWPSSDHDLFYLPSFLVPRERIDLHVANPSSDLKKMYCSDEIPFRIHPEIPFYDGENVNLWQYYRGDSVPVSPTASTRTVLTRGQDQDHFIKLHLPRRIGSPRRLKPKSIEHGVLVSNDLENINNDKFAFLPESIGIVCGGPNGFGFIVRETEPRPHISGGYLIPFFALLAQDLKNVDDKPLLVQMIDYHKENPRDFFVNQIMLPYLHGWSSVLHERGILLESHCQNTLLEVDSNLYPRRIIHRDFQSLRIDPSIREKRSLDLQFKKHLIGYNNSLSLKEQYSLSYDIILGVKCFDEFAKILHHHYGVDPKDIQDRCKELFNHYFPDQSELFPNTIFRFSRKNIFDDNPQIKDTGQNPEWR